MFYYCLDSIITSHPIRCPKCIFFFQQNTMRDVNTTDLVTMSVLAVRSESSRRRTSAPLPPDLNETNAEA